MIRSRFKHFMLERIEFSTTGEETLLSVSEYYGVKPRVKASDQDFAGSTANSLKGYRKVYAGDLVMNYMLAWKGAYGVSKYDGIVSPAYAVFRIDSKYAYRRFIHYRLRTEHMHSVFKARSKGIIDSRLRLYPDVFLSIEITLPDLDIQQAIADFLDRDTSLIDRLIEKKQKKIKLLEEYKQAIIHQAVTGRIDVRTGQPYPTYKPSGVEWLGDVPEHWEMNRLKSVAYHISSQINEFKQGVPYIALENVESWTGRVVPNCIETTESQLKCFQSGDVLFGKLRPYLAKVTRTNFDGQCVGEFLVLRVTDEILGHFLEHLLRSKSVIDWISSSTFGARMPRTDWQFVGNTILTVPPLPEQTAIADFLDNSLANIVKITDHTKRQIELIREYRTRLIADAVTGRIDVREAVEELWQTNSVTCDDEAISNPSEQHY